MSKIEAHVAFFFLFFVVKEKRFMCDICSKIMPRAQFHDGQFRITVDIWDSWGCEDHSISRVYDCKDFLKLKTCPFCGEKLVLKEEHYAY